MVEGKVSSLNLAYQSNDTHNTNTYSLSFDQLDTAPNFIDMVMWGNSFLLFVQKCIDTEPTAWHINYGVYDVSDSGFATDLLAADKSYTAVLAYLRGDAGHQPRNLLYATCSEVSNGSLVIKMVTTEDATIGCNANCLPRREGLGTIKAENVEWIKPIQLEVEYSGFNPAPSVTPKRVINQSYLTQEIYEVIDETEELVEDVVNGVMIIRSDYRPYGCMELLISYYENYLPGGKMRLARGLRRDLIRAQLKNESLQYLDRATLETCCNITSSAFGLSAFKDPILLKGGKCPPHSLVQHTD